MNNAGRSADTIHSQADYAPFVGLDKEQSSELEERLKSRYEISDWVDEDAQGLKNGYLIRDKTTEETFYVAPNARKTLEKRYLEKGPDKSVRENVLDLFARVATNIADADLKYNPGANVEPVAEEFLEALVHQKFIPNTPTLCNAGRALQQLSACFVLPVEDYMATDDIGEDPEKQGNGIYDTLRYMSMVHKSGGGTGFNFSHLRPRSDLISTTFGSSSGPVSFIKVFDASTNAVNQGGFRRGANMGILNYTHPDIFEFIGEKTRNGTLTNFNLSVGIDEDLMKLVDEDGCFRLVNPKGENDSSVLLEERVWKKGNLLRKGTEKYDELVGELSPSLILDENGKNVINTYNEDIVGSVNDEGDILIRARALFDEIAYNAWKEGCPGVVFLDRIQENNTVPHIEEIEATNPCGEQPLPKFGACNLGGVNLANCVTNGEIDYGEIDRRVELGMHFLDNVIDKSKFPFKKIYNAVHSTRRVGLGWLGWAEMLTQLNVPYDSDEAISLAESLSRYITTKAREESCKIADERGVFPAWEGSKFHKEGMKVRNAACTTIAPNGSTGMIFNANGGIEPYISLAYKKTVMDGTELIYINQMLENELNESGLFDEKEFGRIKEKIMKKGGIQDIPEIPEEIKARYKTSFDIAPADHVRMQAAFQRGIDNAVSKTVNMLESATVDDVKEVYREAYKQGCVGVTIFRKNSKEGVFSDLEKRVELVQIPVNVPGILDVKDQSVKMKISRRVNDDSLHINVTSDIYVDDENGKAYFIPDEVFQERAPLGDSTSVSFAQSGMDRTQIFRGPNPDYAEFINRLQSVSSNEEEGLGPMRIKSIEHGVGVALEYLLLSNGVIGRDEHTNGLTNLVKKPELRKVEPDTKEFEEIKSQIRTFHSEGDPVEVVGHSRKLGKKFKCDCGSTDFLIESGCGKPKCAECGGYPHGSC